MANPLQSTVDQLPDGAIGLTPAQRLDQWADMVDTAHAFLQAGFRRNNGANVDLRAEYRAWYEHWMREHDQYLRRMAASMCRVGIRHGR